MYHFGHAFDIDLIEFELKRRVPEYKRMLYIPMDEANIEKTIMDVLACTEKTTIPVDGMESWNAFTCESIEYIIESLERLHHKLDK